MNNMDEKNSILSDVKRQLRLRNVQKTVIGLSILCNLFGLARLCAVEYEQRFDHTKEECMIAKMLPKDEAIKHQINSMKRDYNEKGIIADVEYKEFNGSQPARSIYAPYVPEGYELEIDEFGRQYLVSYKYVEPIENGENKICYVVPEGYTLGRDKDGNPVGIKKIVVELGSKYDDNFKFINGIVYVKLSEKETVELNGDGYRASYLEFKPDGTIEETIDYLKLSR